MQRPLLYLLLLLLFAPSAWAGPSLRVGVSAQWIRREQRDAWQGFITLEVPLDRWATPALPPPAPLIALAEVPFAEPPAPSAPPAPQKGKPPPQTSLMKFEPAVVGKLIAAALRVNSNAAGLEQLSGLSTRSRFSATLPEITLRALRSNDQSLRWSPAGTDTYDYTQSGGAGTLLEARASWKLDRLVFADAELAIERLRLEREARREKLLERLFDQLLSWRRATLLLESGELDPEQLVNAELDLYRAQVELDWLTDGAFSRLAPRLVRR